MIQLYVFFVKVDSVFCRKTNYEKSTPLAQKIKIFSYKRGCMESSRKRTGIVGLKQDIQKALLDPHLIRPIINQHRMNNIAQFPGSRTDGCVMVLAIGNFLLVKSRKHRSRISSHTRD